MGSGYDVRGSIRGVSLDKFEGRDLLVAIYPVRGSIRGVSVDMHRTRPFGCHLPRPTCLPNLCYRLLRVG